MKFCLYTHSISPHQLPLAREIVALLGVDEYRYVYRHELCDERKHLGWLTDRPSWMISADTIEAKKWISGADVLMTGERDATLFLARSSQCKTTIYSAERLFKPLKIGFWKWGFLVDGRFRMLVPRFRRKTKCLIELAKHDPNFLLYPMGIHAARDLAWLLGCTITKFEQVPGGRVIGSGHYLEKMRIWGYFVESSHNRTKRPQTSTSAKTTEFLRILWVGRFLDWKHVEDLIRAVNTVGCSLDIFGIGPESNRLKCLIKNLSNTKITMHHPLPIHEIRTEMNKHDLYVLCSDASEGWGAVISEAIEEQMRIIGTFEAGSSSTILPQSALYHSGDVAALSTLIRGRGTFIDRETWSARTAALTLLRSIGGACDE